MTHETLHETPPDIVKRLRRAEGHPRSIVDMIESGRSCLEIAQQLHASKRRSPRRSAPSFSITSTTASKQRPDR
jgi:hypothetical protein